MRPSWTLRLPKSQGVRLEARRQQGLQALSSSREIARRMKRAASALLPPSFWPSSCSSATARSSSIWSSRSVRVRAPESNARSRMSADVRAFSTAWPFSSRLARKSRRAASAAGPELAATLTVDAGRHLLRRGSAGTALPRLFATAASLPIGVEDAHRDLVPVAAVAPDRVARPTLDREADLQVGLDRPLVELEHRQRDAVEPEDLEGMLEHELRRLGAVTVAPRVLLAERDVVQGGAVVAVELAERTAADQAPRLLPRGPEVDRQREGVRADDPCREEAFDLGRVHRAVLVAGQPGDLGVAVPALEGGQI